MSDIRIAVKLTVIEHRLLWVYTWQANIYIYVCVRVCVRARVYACVCARARTHVLIYTYLCE